MLQTLPATRGTLRHELAAAQHELQMLRSHMGAVESDREHQARSLKDIIARMEADLKSFEPVKVEMQKARAEAHELFVARHELVSKVQDMTQDLPKAHVDMHQFPSLMLKLENLRHEYQHCRELVWRMGKKRKSVGWSLDRSLYSFFCTGKAIPVDFEATRELVQSNDS